MSSSDFTDAHSAAPHYLMWFRRDLRLHDNTALAALCDRANQIYEDQNSPCFQSNNHAKLSAIFMLTPEQWAAHDMSLPQVDLICRTLPILTHTLHSQLQIQLQLLSADTFSDSIEVLIDYCQSNEVTHVFANAEYEVYEQARDDAIAAQLATLGIEFERFHDQCILPPQSVTTNDGSMYQVFTPFYKKWQAILDTSPPCLYQPTLPPPLMSQAPPNADHRDADAVTVDSLTTTAATNTTCPHSLNHQRKLCDATVVNYSQLIERMESSNLTSYSKVASDTVLAATQRDYPAGETAACHRLDQFIADDITCYDISRDQPALNATSQLSAYLTIGSISPRLCYLQAVKALHAPGNAKQQTDIQRWISELAWRDFYRHVMAARPDIVRHHAYKKATDRKINWSYNLSDFVRWCEGKTGVPLIDAAMRCLNRTGFMHNRLRMVTAMFLSKDLLIDWRWGERYFMQHLIDGDFASNNGGWQWSASVGTDAAPYFRIMNPFSQAKTHDKEAVFIKTWLPELKDIPAPILHDENKLRKALSNGGDFSHVNYPLPMVDHKSARLIAIEAFKSG